MRKAANAALTPSSACPLTAAQRARLHPALQSDEHWAWVKDARNPTDAELDATLVHCNRAALPGLARLILTGNAAPAASQKQPITSRTTTDRAVKNG